MADILGEDGGAIGDFYRDVLRSSIVDGVALVRTVYCVSPIFTKPGGRSGSEH